MGALGAVGAVAGGGAVGSLARHGVNIVVAHMFGRPVPLATAVVNIVGSGVIGLLAGLIASGRMGMSVNTRTFVFVGLLGGFTTFSSFSLDTLTLIRAGSFGHAAWNVIGQVGLSLLGAVIGFKLAAS